MPYTYSPVSRAGEKHGVPSGRKLHLKAEEEEKVKFKLKNSEIHAIFVEFNRRSGKTVSNARTYAPCILDLDALGTCPSTIQRGKNDKKRRKKMCSCSSY